MYLLKGNAKYFIHYYVNLIGFISASIELKKTIVVKLVTRF